MSLELKMLGTASRLLREAKKTEGRFQFTHQKGVNILGFYADQGNTLL